MSAAASATTGYAPRQILALVNNRGDSRRGLQTALAACEGHGASLHLVDVDSGSRWSCEPEQMAGLQPADLVIQLRMQRARDEEQRTWREQLAPERSLQQFLNTAWIDLIVIEAREMAALKRLASSPIVESILRTTGAPLLFAGRAAQLSACGPHAPIVLLDGVLDDDRLSAALPGTAARIAKALARHGRAELRAVCVHQPPSSSVLVRLRRHFASALPSGQAASGREAGRAGANTNSAALLNPLLQVSASSLAEGLAAASRTERAGLIALEMPGSPWWNLLQQKTLAALLDDAHCAVLVVRSQHATSPAPVRLPQRGEDRPGAAYAPPNQAGDHGGNYPRPHPYRTTTGPSDHWGSEN